MQLRGLYHPYHLIRPRNSSIETFTPFPTSKPLATPWHQFHGGLHRKSHGSRHVFLATWMNIGTISRRKVFQKSLFPMSLYIEISFQMYWWYIHILHNEILRYLYSFKGLCSFLRCELLVLAGNTCAELPIIGKVWTGQKNESRVLWWGGWHVQLNPRKRPKEMIWNDIFSNRFSSTKKSPVGIHGDWCFFFRISTRFGSMGCWNETSESKTVTVTSLA